MTANPRYRYRYETISGLIARQWQSGCGVLIARFVVLRFAAPCWLFTHPALLTVWPRSGMASLSYGLLVVRPPYVVASLSYGLPMVWTPYGMTSLWPLYGMTCLWCGLLMVGPTFGMASLWYGLLMVFPP